MLKQLDFIQLTLPRRPGFIVSRPFDLVRMRLILILLVMCAPVLGQSHDSLKLNGKKVDKHKTFLKLPLEVTSSRVGEKSINLGEEFDGDGDWLKNLKVTVKNKSGKTITWAFITFRFPDTRVSGSVAVVDCFIGQRSDQRTNNPPLKLEPMQEIEFSPDLRVDALKESIEKRGSLDELNHLDIEVMEVMFDDGILYSGDNIWKLNPDPTSAHKWVKIGPYIR